MNTQPTPPQGSPRQGPNSPVVITHDQWAEVLRQKRDESTGLDAGTIRQIGSGPTAAHVDTVALDTVPGIDRLNNGTVVPLVPAATSQIPAIPRAPDARRGEKGEFKPRTALAIAGAVGLAALTMVAAFSFRGRGDSEAAAATTTTAEGDNSAATPTSLNVENRESNVRIRAFDAKKARTAEEVTAMSGAQLKELYGNRIPEGTAPNEVGRMTIGKNVNKAREAFNEELRHNPQALALFDACFNQDYINYDNCGDKTDPEGRASLARANENLKTIEEMSLREKAVLAEKNIAKLNSLKDLQVWIETDHDGPYNTIVVLRDANGKVIGFDSAVNVRENDSRLVFSYTGPDGKQQRFSIRECDQLTDDREDSEVTTTTTTAKKNSTTTAATQGSTTTTARTTSSSTTTPASSTTTSGSTTSSATTASTSGSTTTSAPSSSTSGSTTPTTAVPTTEGPTSTNTTLGSTTTEITHGPTSTDTTHGPTSTDTTHGPTSTDTTHAPTSSSPTTRPTTTLPPTSVSVSAKPSRPLPSNGDTTPGDPRQPAGTGPANTNRGSTYAPNESRPPSEVQATPTTRNSTTVTKLASSVTTGTTVVSTPPSMPPMSFNLDTTPLTRMPN